MTREELKRRLAEELAKYSRSLDYDRVANLERPMVKQRGVPAPANPDFYQVDVRVLQKWKSGNEDWIELFSP